MFQTYINRDKWNSKPKKNYKIFKEYNLNDMNHSSHFNNMVWTYHYKSLHKHSVV